MTILHLAPARQRTAVKHHVGERLFPGGTILIQSRWGRKCVDLIPYAQTHGIGIVITGARDDKLSEISHLCQASGVAFAVDSERYKAKHRDRPSTDIRSEWITAQHRAGAAFALTDSPYIAFQDVRTLSSVLGQASLAPGAVAALPIAKRWLSKEADLLADEVNRASTPVALMVEDRYDPFSTRAAVQGLCHLLAHSRVPVILLRSDIAALGAVAFGASHGAIGTSTSLRHIYPPVNGGSFRPAEIGLFVRQALSYRTLQTVGFARAQFADRDSMWTCACEVCQNGTIDLIASEDEAARHSIETISDLASSIAASENPAEDWLGHCKSALYLNQEARAAMPHSWSIPGQLQAWLAMAG